MNATSCPEISVARELERDLPRRSELSQAGLRLLYEEHRDLIFRYAASRCGREAALDVVADTFVEVARHSSAHDPSRGSQAAWLLGIATNRIHRMRRIESRFVPLEDDSARSLGGYDADLLDLPGRIDDQRQAESVRAAIGELPEGERSAFLLYAVEGLSQGEVATALAISRSAAKLRLFRARRRLRASLRHLDLSKESA